MYKRILILKIREVLKLKLSKKLKNLRKEHNLTQQKEAEKLNISRKTVSSWENDRTYPDIPMLISISKLYGENLDDLLKDDNQILEHFKNQDIISNRSLKIARVCYVLNAFLVVAGYLDLIKIFNKGVIMIPILILINLITLIFNIPKDYGSITRKQIIVSTSIGILIFSLTFCVSVIVPSISPNTLTSYTILGGFLLGRAIYSFIITVCIITLGEYQKIY